MSLRELTIEVFEPTSDYDRDFRSAIRQLLPRLVQGLEVVRALGFQGCKRSSRLACGPPSLFELSLQSRAFAFERTSARIELRLLGSQRVEAPIEVRLRSRAGAGIRFA